MTPWDIIAEMRGKVIWLDGYAAASSSLHISGAMREWIKKWSDELEQCLMQTPEEGLRDRGDGIKK